MSAMLNLLSTRKSLPLSAVSRTCQYMGSCHNQAEKEQHQSRAVVCSQSKGNWRPWQQPHLIQSPGLVGVAVDTILHTLWGVAREMIGLSLHGSQSPAGWWCIIDRSGISCWQRMLGCSNGSEAAYYSETLTPSATSAN
jgi:hypothetical protein